MWYWCHVGAFPCDYWLLTTKFKLLVYYPHSCMDTCGTVCIIVAWSLYIVLRLDYVSDCIWTYGLFTFFFFQTYLNHGCSVICSSWPFISWWKILHGLSYCMFWLVVQAYHIYFSLFFYLILLILRPCIFHIQPLKISLSIVDPIYILQNISC